MTAGNTKRFLTIVSGLPRSGTSMMMRMLEAGGMPIISDSLRGADADNPNGYYECEAVKKTRQDATWLQGSEGKAVKMVYRLLYDLPTDRSYRVLFMARNMKEVVASQRIMLDRNGLGNDGISDGHMEQLFQSELSSFFDWVSCQDHIQLMNVNYNRIQHDALEELSRVNDFLESTFDVNVMSSVVDKSLYRNRQ